MPAPRWLACFNRDATNRLTTPVAGHLRGFGLIEHVGRRTHKRYRTPVLAFRRGGSYVIALTYGPQTDWVQNVLTAGECALLTRGRRIALSKPRLLHEELHRPVPPLVSFVLGLARISDFIELRASTQSES